MLRWHRTDPTIPARVLHSTLTLSGVKRLNLGGKALTNLLKETVSYRSLDMRDEGLLMEQLKEQLCWVSQVRCLC
jgi:actin-related protein 6